MLKLVMADDRQPGEVKKWQSREVTPDQVPAHTPLPVAEMAALAHSLGLMVHVWVPTHMEIFGAADVVLCVTFTRSGTDAQVTGYAHRTGGLPGNVRITAEQATEWIKRQPVALATR